MTQAQKKDEITVREHTRTKPKRADGTEIKPTDSLKALGDYLETIPQSAIEPETPPPASAPPESPPTPAEPPAPVDPEFAGLTSEQIIAKVREERESRAQLQRDLEQERRRNETRQIVREEMPRPAVQLHPPPVAAPDPREQEIEDKWFSDPKRARQLQRELEQERFDQLRTQLKTEIRQESTVETQAQQRINSGRNAFAQAQQELLKLGVPESAFTPNRVTGLYSTLTRRPTDTLPNEHFREDGAQLTDPRFIVAAWKDMYGLPTATTPAPIPPTPPGSSRPAPAASPRPTASSAPLDPQRENDIKELAHRLKRFGATEEGLRKRQRERQS